MKANAVRKTLLRDGFILVFNEDRLDVVKTADALMRAGVGNMEITCRIRNPLEKMARLKQSQPDFVVGAASLVDHSAFLDRYNAHHPEDTLPTVDAVVEAGVDYLVSAASFSPETYQKYAATHPMIPGCGTVSEIVAQYAMGATCVKIFPASQLGGPSFVKAIDPAIHRLISLVPTGGTTCENIPAYIHAGILVVGGSFSIVGKDSLARIIENQDYDLLSSEIARIKDGIDTARSQAWPGLDFSTATVEAISSATGRGFNKP